MAKEYFQDVTVGSTSTAVLARDPSPRDVVILTNNSDEEMFINIGGEDAELNKGICIEVGQQFIMRRSDQSMLNGEINAICSSGSKNLAVYVVNARLAKYEVSVNDSVSIAENFDEMPFLMPNVNDSVSIAEDVSISIA